MTTGQPVPAVPEGTPGGTGTTPGEPFVERALTYIYEDEYDRLIRVEAAAVKLQLAVRAAHPLPRHYPCDICDRAEGLAAALSSAQPTPAEGGPEEDVT